MKKLLHFLLPLCLVFSVAAAATNAKRPIFDYNTASASAAMVANTQYKYTLTSNLTATSFTGTTEGSTIVVELVGCDGTHSFSFPNSRRIGGADSDTSSVTPTAGNHRIVFERIGSTWYYADSVFALPASYLDTDTTLAGNSDVKVASQKATKTYADGKVANAINSGTTTIAPGQDAVYSALALKGDLSLSTNAQTGTTYTYVAGDAGKLVTLSNGSAITATVPPNSSVAFPVGTKIYSKQLSTGAVTFAPGSGVTITQMSSTLTIGASGHYAALLKTATDTWELRIDMLDGSAAADPTANDDIADGYQTGSVWRNTSSGALFYCVSNTVTAASWTAISTTARIRSTAGTATLSAAGDINVDTTNNQIGVHNGTKEVVIPLVQHFEISFDPKAVCDGTIDRLFLFRVGAWAPKGITIRAVYISFEADPTTELDIDLKRADAFIGVANSAVMLAADTSAGVKTETTAANINSGAIVATGKVVYLEFATAYTEANHQVHIDMEYEIEED